jgi:nuclear pore complex protein Nup62
LQEIHDALSSIESEAEALLQPEKALMGGDAAERDALYARAMAVSSALLQLGAQLQTAVREREGLCFCVSLRVGGWHKRAWMEG